MCSFSCHYIATLPTLGQCSARYTRLQVRTSECETRDTGSSQTLTRLVTVRKVEEGAGRMVLEGGRSYVQRFERRELGGWFGKLILHSEVRTLSKRMRRTKYFLSVCPSVPPLSPPPPSSQSPPPQHHSSIPNMCVWITKQMGEAPGNVEMKRVDFVFLLLPSFSFRDQIWLCGGEEVEIIFFLTSHITLS